MNKINIIDLNKKYLKTFFCCLEDWSDEMKEAGDHKQKWFEKMKNKGLRIKLALDENDNACGMIQYAPIEYSPAEGNDLYFIYCIWVHGYKGKGVGNMQKQGMGKALIQATEKDTKELGTKGIVAWGLSLPFWMKAVWFKKQGFKKIDKIGMQVLLWKQFTDDAVPPKWISEKKKPEKVPDKVNVTAFLNGWCPAQNIVFERAKRATAEFGDKVEFTEIDTFDRENFLEWGISDALYINGKQIRTGPPPSYEKIKKLIKKRVKKL